MVPGFFKGAGIKISSHGVGHTFHGIDQNTHSGIDMLNWAGHLVSQRKGRSDCCQRDSPPFSESRGLSAFCGPALAVNFFFALLIVLNLPVDSGNHKSPFFPWKIEKFMWKFVKFMKAIESNRGFRITFIY